MISVLLKKATPRSRLTTGRFAPSFSTQTLQCHDTLQIVHTTRRSSFCSDADTKRPTISSLLHRFDNTHWNGDKSSWITTVNFKKVFDSVEHCGVWKAFQERGIEECCNERLKDLNREQSAQVSTDTESRPFKSWKRTKHGDQPSALLFNALSHHTMEVITKEWRLGEGEKSPATSGSLATLWSR